MQPPRRPIWTTARRLQGNLLPLLVVGPCLAKTLSVVTFQGLSLEGWLWIGATLGLGWLAVNLLGLSGNRSMRAELFRRFSEERPDDRHPRWFVGFARPSFRGLLDPHEDIGFLVIEYDHIVFWGEERRVELHRDQITRVHWRPNIHTFLGLGRWISVEAVLDKRPARMLVEPRDKRTLLGNLILGSSIKRKLMAWAIGSR